MSKFFRPLSILGQLSDIISQEDKESKDSNITFSGAGVNQSNVRNALLPPIARFNKKGILSGLEATQSKNNFSSSSKYNPQKDESEESSAKVVPESDRERIVKNTKKVLRELLAPGTELSNGVLAEKTEKEIISLIEKGEVDINYQDKEQGDTLLIVSALGGFTEITKLLIERGANLNTQRKSRSINGEFTGDTALIIAADRGNIKEVLLLIDAGADITIVNEDGQTALAAAAERVDDRIRKTVCEIVTHVMVLGNEHGLIKDGQRMSNQAFIKQELLQKPQIRDCLVEYLEDSSAIESLKKFGIEVPKIPNNSAESPVASKVDNNASKSLEK